MIAPHVSGAPHHALVEQGGVVRRMMPGRG